MFVVDESRFEQLVAEALDSLPPEIGSLMSNVVVVVEDFGEDSRLLGLYEGIPLTERHDYGGLVMPDMVRLFRLPICAACETEQDVIDEVGVTVVHEIAHHFGIDDPRLHELGWG